MHVIGPSHAPHVPLTQYGCAGSWHSLLAAHGLFLAGCELAHANTIATPRNNAARTRLL